MKRNKSDQEEQVTTRHKIPLEKKCYHKKLAIAWHQSYIHFVKAISHKAAATRKKIFYNTKMVFITSDGDQRRKISNQNVKQLWRVISWLTNKI